MLPGCHGVSLGAGSDTPASQQLGTEYNPLIERMNKLEAAISQMDIGQYGYCCDCEEKISEQRLERDPAAQRCRVLSNPEMIKVEEQQEKSTIKQYFYKMDNNKQRYPTLKLLDPPAGRSSGPAGGDGAAERAIFAPTTHMN